MIDHGLKVREGCIYLTIPAKDGTAFREVAVNGRIYRPIGHEKPRGMLMPAVLSASAQTIMDHYGLYRQLTQLMEECGELIIASNHYLRKRNSDDAGERFVAETDFKREIADVLVVMDQIMVRMGMDEEEIKFIEECKINRQISRIRNV